MPDRIEITAGISVVMAWLSDERTGEVGVSIGPGGSDDPVGVFLSREQAKQLADFLYNAS